MRFRLKTLDFQRTQIMGVLNVTPDSFSDGWLSFTAKDAIAHGRALFAAGADIVDVGGESTRPGAQAVSLDEECARVLWVVRALAEEGVVSIDTYKAQVAERAIAAGAEIVNDISGGQYEPKILAVAAKQGAAMVLGHVRGRPSEMQSQANYSDVVAEVRAELSERVAHARAAGIERIFIDPGLGFAKTAAHNLSLLANLREFLSLGCPIVIGASRKSFLAKITGRSEEDRELGTAAADTAAILNGASVVRVHDVARQRDAVQVADAIRSGA